jgi:uncharacterized protein YidB (DUF937 family)
MTALLGLLAVAGYQNRDKIAEMLGNLTKGGSSPSGAPAGGATANLPGGLGGLLAGTSVGGLLNGGLGELMDKFNQAGQKDKVDSWVSTGPNKDVAPTELQTALGPDVLAALSRATGLSEQELVNRLAKTLPQAVDQYTPQGRIA